MKAEFQTPDVFVDVEWLLRIKFHDLAVVNTKELVQASNHGFLAAFAFAAFFLYKVIDRIVSWFVFDKRLHDLVAGLAEIRVASF